MAKWKKVYKGPFAKDEALEIVQELKQKADPEINGILKVAIRKRFSKIKCVCTAACGAGVGHNNKYDVYIKSDI